MIYSELKDDINAFLSKNAIWLAIVIVAIIVIVALLIILLNKNKSKKDDSKISKDESKWQTAIGGKDNINEITAVGSRLTLNLKNNDLINKEALKELGVSNILTMSEKIILVVEDSADKVKERLLK